MDPLDLGLGIAMVVGSTGLVAVGVMFARAVMRKWARPAAAIGSAEVQELRRAVSELAADVAELHERVDFAERMLTSRQDLPQLEERSS